MRDDNSGSTSRTDRQVTVDGQVTHEGISVTVYGVNNEVLDETWLTWAELEERKECNESDFTFELSREDVAFLFPSIDPTIDTEQVVPREDLELTDNMDGDLLYRCPRCSYSPVTEFCDCPNCGWAGMCQPEFTDEPTGADPDDTVDVAHPLTESVPESTEQQDSEIETNTRLSPLLSSSTEFDITATGCDGTHLFYEFSDSSPLDGITIDEANGTVTLHE